MGIVHISSAFIIYTRHSPENTDMIFLIFCDFCILDNSPFPSSIPHAFQINFNSLYTALCICFSLLRPPQETDVATAWFRSVLPDSKLNHDREKGARAIRPCGQPRPEGIFRSLPLWPLCTSAGSFSVKYNGDHLCHVEDGFLLCSLGWNCLASLNSALFSFTLGSRHTFVSACSHAFTRGLVSLRTIS